MIALLVFGPKRLPDLGRSLGSGMREFKDSITGKSDDSPDDGDSVGKSLGSGMREFKDSIAGSDGGDRERVEADSEQIDGSAEELAETGAPTSAKT